MEQNKNEKCNKCHIKDCPRDDTCNAPIKEYCNSLAHLPQTEEVQEKKIYNWGEKSKCCDEQISCNGNCLKCGIEVNNTVQAETVGWEERLFKQPIVKLISLKDPIYGNENAVVISKLSNFIRSERLLAQSELYEAILEKQGGIMTDAGQSFVIDVSDIEAVVKNKGVI